MILIFPLLRYPLWYMVTNATNPSSMNIFHTPPYAMFSYHIPNNSGLRGGWPPQIYIKINNNSWNRSTCCWYVTTADLRNCSWLSINCSCNAGSSYILLYNYHCPSTTNRLRSSSKNVYLIHVSARLSHNRSHSMGGTCVLSTSLSPFIPIIINLLNNSSCASSTNPCTIDRT